MLLRALIGVTLFSAAYMAEVVRGGLQAIDKGQYENDAWVCLTIDATGDFATADPCDTGRINTHWLVQGYGVG